MCGTGTVTGGGAKHVGEWRAGAEATTVGRAVAVRLLHRDEARRQKAAAGFRVEAASLSGMRGTNFRAAPSSVLLRY